MRSVQFGLSSIHIFLSFFLFLSVFSLTDTNDSQDSREERGNPYFSCFPLPFTHEHTVQKMKFSIKDLLKKSLMENFIFCAVTFISLIEISTTSV